MTSMPQTTQQRVLDSVASGLSRVSDIATKLGLPAHVVGEALVALQRDGMVKHRISGWKATTRKRPVYDASADAEHARQESGPLTIVRMREPAEPRITARQLTGIGRIKPARTGSPVVGKRTTISRRDS